MCVMLSGYGSRRSGMGRVFDGGDHVSPVDPLLQEARPRALRSVAERHGPGGPAGLQNR